MSSKNAPPGKQSAFLLKPPSLKDKKPLDIP